MSLHLPALLPALLPAGSSGRLPCGASGGPMGAATGGMAMRRGLLLGAAALGSLALAGCANVAKVSTGEVLVADRVAMTLTDAWNQVNLPGRSMPLVWTQDGLPLDALEFWVGVKDGQALGEASKNQRPIVFKAGMAGHEIAALFEALIGRDGSSYQLVKLSPEPFLGGAAIRIDFEVVRKVDDVRALGVAWAAVRGSELFAMVFTAPRLGFFPRHLAKVEAAARSARLK